MGRTPDPRFHPRIAKLTAATVAAVAQPNPISGYRTNG